MLSALTDSLLARYSAGLSRNPGFDALTTRSVDTPVGRVRVFDSGTDKPCVVFVPDGPNVIEHYVRLIELLSPHVRVVCFDLPGFGFSLPGASYQHSLDEGARAVLGVLDKLRLQTATLAFSCANGFYALRAAQLAPQRIKHLVLSQTPSLIAMQAWTKIIPWPLRVPVMGQLVAWFARRRFAHAWYLRALPRATDARPYQTKARHAFACGACFSLAGVVQGLCREPMDTLGTIATPCTVVWGSKDHSHKATDPKSLLACVPHAEMVYFEDCGHFPDIEQPERYAALVMRRVLMVASQAQAQF